MDPQHAAGQHPCNRAKDANRHSELEGCAAHAAPGCQEYGSIDAPCGEVKRNRKKMRERLQDLKEL
jgi:hypothetical protein